MKGYLDEHRKLFGIGGGIIAFIVAAIYLKAIPEEALSASGLQK